MPGAAAVDVLISSKSVALPDGTRSVLLRQLHLTASPGETVVLLGPSGVGKTTVLRIALGLDTDFVGDAHVSGDRTGVVFQEPTLLPWLSVADNLRLVIGKQADKKIRELLELVELPPIVDHMPSELSLGMARRVALARALCVDPTLLVLDEPFASLEPRLGAKLAERIAERARCSGSAMLLATHDLAHALIMADRICVLAGRPATLAADVTVPARGNPGAVRDLRDQLVQRFAFLGADDTASGASATTIT